MKEKELKKKIEVILADESQSVEDRLESLLGLSVVEDEKETAFSKEEKKERLREELLIYSAAKDLVRENNNFHDRDLTLMQLYVLLAETYDDLYDYRPIKKLASEVLYLMRDGQTSVEVLKETVPRLTDAIGNSVYNHLLFEILLRYVKVALEKNPGDRDVKNQARKLLKLSILLDFPDRYTKIWTKELEKRIAGLFTSEELVHIIAHPQLGHLMRDPVEYTLKWEDIYYDLEDELDRRFANAPDFMGRCFQIWSVKKEILEERYGIDWHSPSQMNPHVMFD